MGQRRNRARASIHQLWSGFNLVPVSGRHLDAAGANARNVGQKLLMTRVQAVGRNCTLPHWHRALTGRKQGAPDEEESEHNAQRPIA
jgi:hypothetical protein